MSTVHADSDLMMEPEGSVYRFYNASTNKHVLIMDYKEANSIYKTNKAWTYEGVVFKAFLYAYPKCKNNEYQNVYPVYRFWNKTMESHFYALPNEAAHLQLNPAWKNEGIIFCAATTNSSEEDLVEAYRFFSPSNTTHVFTANKNEKSIIEKNSKYVYEGIPFKVLPIQY